MKKLRVFAAGETLVGNIEVPPTHWHRFVGRKFNDELGGWEPLDEPVEVPFCREYVEALQHGELEPADEETEVLAGLKKGAK